MLPTTGLTTSEAGGTATFTLVLDSQPSGAVTIGMASAGTGEGGVSVASVVFGSANWAVTQTVTLTGQDDDVVDGDIAYSGVTGAGSSGADTNFHGVDVADVGATNEDGRACDGSRVMFCVKLCVFLCVTSACHTFTY